MPQVRKLTDAEVSALSNKGKGTRKLVEEEYDAILGEYSVGDYGEANLDPGENRLTVRNRIKAAAKRRDLGINFSRTSTDLLRFKVVANDSKGPEPVAAAPEPEPEPAPTKRRGGRPKKSA